MGCLQLSVLEKNYNPLRVVRRGFEPIQNEVLGKNLESKKWGTNWLAYGARFYDPTIGRFTGVDPISDEFPHLSTYNYASNNPVTNIDLHGLQGMPATVLWNFLSPPSNGRHSGNSGIPKWIQAVSKPPPNNSAKNREALIKFFTPNEKVAEQTDGGVAFETTNGPDIGTKDINPGADQVNIEEMVMGGKSASGGAKNMMKLFELGSNVKSEGEMKERATATKSDTSFSTNEAGDTTQMKVKTTYGIWRPVIKGGVQVLGSTTEIHKTHKDGDK